MSRFAINSLLYLVAFLTPSVLALFLPISLSQKFTSFGILLLLFIPFGLGIRKVKYDKALILLIIFIGVNIGYFFLSVYKFEFSPFSSDNFPITLGVVSSIMAMVSALVYYNLFLRFRPSLQIVSNLFTLGALSNATMGILIYIILTTVLDISSNYEFRELTYSIAYDDEFSSKAETLPSEVLLVFGYFGIMGGTVGIGPFASFIGTFVLGLAIFSKSKRKTLIFGVFTLILFYTAYTMASRSAIISPLIGILIVSVFLVYTRNRDYFLPTVIVSFAGFFIMISGLILLSESVDSLSRFSWDDLSESPRLYLWKSAIKLVSVNPFGYGYDYIRLGNHEFYGEFPFGEKFEFDHAHNIYVTTLLEFGVFGFLVLILLFYSILRSAFRNIIYYRGHKLEGIAVGSTAALIVGYIQFIFESLFLRYETIYGSTFWMLVAIILTLSQFHSRKYLIQA